MVFIPDRDPVCIKQEVARRVRKCCIAFGCGQCTIGKYLKASCRKTDAGIISEIPVARLLAEAGMQEQGAKQESRELHI